MDWLQIHPDENFGCIVFSGFDPIFENVSLPLTLGDCCISGELPFALDDWWRDQLGKTVIERLEKYPDLVLSSKGSDSDEPLLSLKRAEWLLWGIAVIAGIPTFELARGIFGRIDEKRVPLIIHVGFFRHSVAASASTEQDQRGGLFASCPLRRAGGEHVQRETTEPEVVLAGVKRFYCLQNGCSRAARGGSASPICQEHRIVSSTQCFP